MRAPRLIGCTWCARCARACVQMFLGLVCSLLNARHFRSKIDELAVFVPQVLFMLAIFGYLCFAIVYKWLVDWVALGLRPPSLISMLIAFAMSPGTIPADAVLFPGQAVVQLLLFVVALVAVPWMLLAKPLLLKRQHDAAATGYAPLGGKGDDDSAKPKSVMAAAVPSDFDFGEVMMHSVIHTIEYVLGTVSNTASYLRLWALSLAHKQLSVVFYEMILLEQVWVGSQSYYRSRAALPPHHLLTLSLLPLHSLASSAGACTLLARKPPACQRPLHCASICRVAVRHCGHPLLHGASLGFPARAEVALGRVYEQVLPRWRAQVSTVLPLTFAPVRSLQPPNSVTAARERVDAYCATGDSTPTHGGIDGGVLAAWTLVAVAVADGDESGGHGSETSPGLCESGEVG